MSSANGLAPVTGDPVHPRVRPAPAAPRDTPRAPAHWYPPEGLAHRGTVVLLPGRGEHPGVYERFGRRLAADAYVVHVLDAGSGRTAQQIASDVDALAADAPRPLVLAGSDTGALLALAAAARTPAAPDALLLAGTPAPTAGTDSAGDTEARTATATAVTAAPTAEAGPGWTDELAARTACPAHRGRLAADPHFAAGALSSPVPGGLTEEAAAAVSGLAALPVLILHGAADPVSPLAGARALAGRLPAATFATVRDGRHDSFNDIQHRSVAALVVQWLERLRGGDGRSPILTVEGTPVV